jgi:hypothetical protein
MPQPHEQQDTPKPQQAAVQRRQPTHEEIEARKKLIKRRRAVLAGITVFFFAAATVLVLFISGVFSKDTDTIMPPLNTQTSAPTTTVPQKSINPLTGLRDLEPDAVGKRGVTAMVNNAPAARPQWGLCSADIVAEALVEGGITRMLYMYADVRDMPKIGPIRSARHDFVELTEGFDSFYVHFGGSPQAYEAISARGVNDLDGMVYSGKYFFRDKTRLNQGYAVEHTAYTTGEYIAAGIAAKGWRTELAAGKESPFRFVAEGAAKRVPTDGAAASVSFRYSASFKYSFTYDAASGLYAQSLNGTPFVQEGGEQRKVTNVVLIYVNVSNIEGDKKGRVNIDLSGGSGLYATAGGYQAITWKKGDAQQALKLYAMDGSELEINRGKGYLGMVPSSQKSYTSIG